jgi:hypothetical protein
MGEEKHPHKRREEADDADAHTGPEMLAGHRRIYLGPGQEGQQNGAEAREEIDPGCQRQTDQVARDGADHDFDKCHRYRDPDRQHGRDERKPDPQGRCEPDRGH